MPGGSKQGVSVNQQQQQQDSPAHGKRVGQLGKGDHDGWSPFELPLPSPGWDDDDGVRTLATLGTESDAGIADMYYCFPWLGRLGRDTDGQDCLMEHTWGRRERRRLERGGKRREPWWSRRVLPLVERFGTRNKARERPLANGRDRLPAQVSSQAAVSTMSFLRDICSS